MYSFQKERNQCVVSKEVFFFWDSAKEKRLVSMTNVTRRGMSSYSRGQPNPSKLLSRQGVHLGPRFLQILAQIVEMNQKTHLRKLSHNVLGLPIFWDKKSQHF